MLSELEKILETHFEDSDGALPSLEVQEDEVDEFRIVDGDLVVDNLEVTTVTLIRGNLTINESLEQSPAHSLLIVLGDMPDDTTNKQERQS